MDFIQQLERADMTKARKIEFKAGDTVRVHVKVVEGGKERIQVFEGVVISRRGGGRRESFTVRKLSAGIGVERVFPLHSPIIKKIDVTRHGQTRQSRIYYLRDRVGKAARITEKKFVGSKARRAARVPGEETPEKAQAESPEAAAEASA